MKALYVDKEIGFVVGKGKIIMKKKYKRPMASQTIFQANEYVAACYKINCTTPNDNATFHYLYDDTNKNGVYDQKDKLVYSNFLGFTGCSHWHKGIIKSEAPTANGFVKAYGGKAYSVFYWKEHLSNDSVDYHVMTPGRENYETNPNAS